LKTVKMGFRTRPASICQRGHADYPGSTAYYDKTYGPRGWSNAVILNLSIGQGENTQTLINMLKFYSALAGAGKTATPYLVHPDSAATFDLGLTPDQLEGLRTALIAVVERGTAARSRRADLQIAGKTGTAQNPHGKDHGWFIGFAPAEKPEIIVGAIFEFGEHGTVVAPYVVRAISRYLLGPDSTGAKPNIRSLLRRTRRPAKSKQPGARSAH
jgi:penicillin-binding protein 2